MTNKDSKGDAFDDSALAKAYRISNSVTRADREASAQKLTEPAIQETVFLDAVKRGIKQFLGIPIAICLGSIVFAIIISIFDANPPNLLEDFRSWLTTALFTETSSTIGALDMMAAGMFGLSTITFSMLLIALQQSAGATSIQVIDGFVGRNRNQVVLGSLLGITIFIVVTRVLGDSEINPAIGAFLSLIFTLMSVFILAALFYLVTNQSRPNFIADDLRAKILHSRRRSHEYLKKTRRTSACPQTSFTQVLATGRGYISTIDFEGLRKLAAQNPEGEIELLCEIGDYLIHRDPIVKLRALIRVDHDAVRACIFQDSQRSLETDPTAGLVKIGGMSWRTGSSAVQNQQTTVDAINAMSDILAHWLHDEPLLSQSHEWNVVYPDSSLLRLIDTFEMQLAVASKSSQPLPVVTIYNVFIRCFDRMTPEVLQRVYDVIARSLSSLDAHYFTFRLEETLASLENALRDNGDADIADRVAEKLESLR